MKINFDVGSVRWTGLVFQAFCGGRLPRWAVKLAINPWKIPAVLSLCAILAGFISIPARTHFLGFKVDATLNAQTFTYHLPFGYLAESNFFLWLTIFLPMLWWSLRKAICGIGTALSDLQSNENSPNEALARITAPKDEDAIIASLMDAMYPIERKFISWKPFAQFLRKGFLGLLLVLPLLSILFQVMVFLNAVQLPLKADQLKNDFDFGNTQAPTLEPLSQSFNTLTSKDQWAAISKNRNEQMRHLAEVVLGKHPLDRPDLDAFYKHGDVGDIKLKLTPRVKSDDYRSNREHACYIIYIVLAYGLQGVGWSVSVFALHVLVRQFVMWRQLILRNTGGILLDLPKVRAKQYGLECIEDIASWLQIVVLVGASYLLFQCVQPSGFNDALADNGKGGTIELKVFNLSLIAFALLVFIIAIPLINMAATSRADQNGMSPADMRGQSIFPLKDVIGFRSVIMEIIAVGLPISTALNPTLFKVWEGVRVFWLDFLESHFPFH